MSEQITYADAGVDIDAGDRAVELMKASVKSTLNSRVLDLSGGFAGMFDISDFKNMAHPVLCTSTDGVGTKIEIARILDKHDTIGYDLVGMVVDDITVTGAKPLFMTDYICVGKVVPTRIAEIVAGVANACKEADTALVGGETAEHPGLLAPDEYDIAGAATGIIDKADALGGDRVNAGDALIALASSGLHSNGFSLVRAAVAKAGLDYRAACSDLAGSPVLGEALLEPTRIYSRVCLDLAKECNISTFSHITGGGIAANVARVLPRGVTAVIDRQTWELPEIFKFIANLGGVPSNDLERTLNCGIGMLAIAPASEVDRILKIAAKHGIDAWQCGVTYASDNIPSDLQSGFASNEVAANTKGVTGGSAVLLNTYKQ